MENSHSRATTLPSPPRPSIYITPAHPHHPLVPTIPSSGTYVQPPLCNEILFPPPAVPWYRMCGNVATVKYIRTGGRGGRGHEKELATCTTFKSGRNPGRPLDSPPRRNSRKRGPPGGSRVAVYDREAAPGFARIPPRGVPSIETIAPDRPDTRREHVRLEKERNSACAPARRPSRFPRASEAPV